MRLLLENEYIEADLARKSKVCTMLFSIGQKEFEIITSAAEDMQGII